MPRKRNTNPDCFYDDFPTRLRKIMEEQSCTQQDLANLLGKSRQAIGYYADGSSKPDLKSLVTIAKRFDVSVDWLLGLSDYQAGLSDTASRFLRDLEKCKAKIEQLDCYADYYRMRCLEYEKALQGVANKYCVDADLEEQYEYGMIPIDAHGEEALENVISALHLKEGDPQCYIDPSFWGEI